MRMGEEGRPLRYLTLFALRYTGRDLDAGDAPKGCETGTIVAIEGMSAEVVRVQYVAHPHWDVLPFPRQVTERPFGHRNAPARGVLDKLLYGSDWRGLWCSATASTLHDDRQAHRWGT